MVKHLKYPCTFDDYIIKAKIDSNIINNIIKMSIHCNTSYVKIYKNNKIILDLVNKNDKKLIETYSLTKSFLSFAIMFLIQDKKIKSVNDKISKYIKSWEYGKKKNITIKEILTHTSGLDSYWNFDEFMYPHGKYKLLNKKNYKTPNVYNISLTIDKTDCAYWKYNDTASQIIPTLVKIITGLQIDKYLNNKLFKKLNIKYKWNKDSYGNPYGPSGLLISADDLCKIGFLILNNGFYEKQKIINNNLLNEMLKIRIKNKDMKYDKISYKQKKDYGYFWWIHNNLNIASGYIGQYLIIDKKRKIVAVRLIQEKFDNKKFEKDCCNSCQIHFNCFPNLIEKI